MVSGLRHIADSIFRLFREDLDTRMLPPMYRALGTKSIVMKINGQGGVQANIGLWVKTHS